MLFVCVLNGSQLVSRIRGTLSAYGESEFSIGHAIKMGIKCVMTKINKRLKVNGAQKKKIYNELC